MGNKRSGNVNSLDCLLCEQSFGVGIALCLLLEPKFILNFLFYEVWKSPLNVKHSKVIDIDIRRLSVAILFISNEVQQFSFYGYR